MIPSKSLKLLFVTAGAGLLVAACAPSPTPALSDEDVVAIREVHEQLYRALEAADWLALASLYVENGVAMPPGGQMVVGRAAIEEWASGVPITFLERTAKDIRVDGRSDLAYLRATYSTTFRLGKSQDTLQDNGKQVWVLRRQPDGSWLIEAAIWNSNEPPS